MSLSAYLRDNLAAIGVGVLCCLGVAGMLAVLGVVSDPTTAGVGDSERAQGYTEPWKDETTTD